MADKPYFILAALRIDDRERYAEYERGFGAVLHEYGGELLAFDDAPATIEGTPPEGRLVILRFPGEDAARRWYDSDAYQALMQHRLEASETHFLALLRGMQAAR